MKIEDDMSSMYNKKEENLAYIGKPIYSCSSKDLFQNTNDDYN